MRVPDNGYRYRTDAPIEEYFQNWGHVLGQMHALTKDYHPTSEEKQPGLRGLTCIKADWPWSVNCRSGSIGLRQRANPCWMKSGRCQKIKTLSV